MDKIFPFWDNGQKTMNFTKQVKLETEKVTEFKEVEKNKTTNKYTDLINKLKIQPNQS